MEVLAVLGGAWFIVVIVALALCILWFFLPFAVFGVKPLLTRLITEQKAGNDLTRQLLVELRGGRPAAAPVPAAAPEPPSPPATPAVVDVGTPPAPAVPRPPARVKGMSPQEREALMARARQLAAEREARGAGHLDVD